MRASSLPLLTRCVGSETLPRDDTKSPNADRGAEWGTMVHHWKETGIVRCANKRAAKAFATALNLSGVGAAGRQVYWPEGGSHETSLALWVGASGGMPKRVLTGADAEAVAGVPGWITGHSDFYWRLVDGTLWVDDLKTGKLYPNPEPGTWGHDPSLEVGVNRFPQDPGSPQHQFYALAISEVLGYTGGVLTSTTHWPRLPLAARHQPPTRYFDSFSRTVLLKYWDGLAALEATRVRNESIVSLQSGAVGDSLSLNPGSHCRFCPSRNYCFVAEEFG